MSLTIKDIAEMSGVSKGTVSRVINNNPEGVSEETRNKILQLIDEVGYVPNRMARSITVSETKTIGLIIPDIQNPFFTHVVRGVEDYSIENGYTVFLCNSDSDTKKETKYLYNFLEKRVDGIILNSCGNLKDPKLSSLIHNSNTPVVLLDRKTDDFFDYPGVFVNNMLATYEGVSYLAKGGAKHIAYLAGEKNVYTVEERLKGYYKALEEAGLKVKSKYINYGNYKIQSGYERMKKIIQLNPEIDAVFAGSDTIAIGVLKALREMHIPVPDQVEVIGFDNIEMSGEITPALSTIAQPMYEMGYKAAQMLLSSINNKTIKQADQYLSTALLIRDSTKRKNEGSL